MKFSFPHAFVCVENETHSLPRKVVFLAVRTTVLSLSVFCGEKNGLVIAGGKTNPQ